MGAKSLVPSGAECAGVPAVSLNTLAIGAPVARPYNEIMDAEGGQPTVQHIAERSGLVAAMHRIRLCNLPLDEANKALLAEPLRRLGALLIDLPHHHNETGVNVQPEFNHPGASARVCLNVLIRTHDADSLAPRAPLVRPMSYWMSAVVHPRTADVHKTGAVLV